MNINTARNDILAARVDRRIAGQPVADRDHLLALDQHIGLVGLAGRDDRPAFD
jgi:hypothetical protein